VVSIVRFLYGDGIRPGRWARLRPLRPTALVTLLTLLAATPVLADEFVVAPGGNDRASGRPGQPWRTLQKAADTVEEGDRVVVEDGDYRGFTVDERDFGPRRVTFVARNKWKARVTSPSLKYGKNDGIAIVSSSYVTIDGFEVTGAKRAGIVVRSFPPEPAGKDTRDNIIRNCWSHDNGVWGKAEGAHDGIFTGWAYNVLIEGNRVERNAEHGIYVSNSADNPIIRNNVVKGNWAQGIQINADGELDGDGIITNWEISGNVVTENSLKGGSTAINLDGAVRGRAFNNLIHGNGRGGFVLWQGNGNSSSNENVFFNNTVYNPRGDKAAFIFYTGAANNVVFNNILYSPIGGIEIDEEAGKGNRHDFNLVASVYGKGKLAANESSPPVTALFIDPARGNLRPSPGGPSIDKGTAGFAGRQVSTVDLEGRPRAQNSAPDVGCYESSPTEF
jgi:parallel beta-helix repeat protein